MHHCRVVWLCLIGLSGCLPEGGLVGAGSRPGTNGSDAITQPTPGSGGGLGSGRTGTGGGSGGGSSGGGSGPSVNTCPAGTLRVGDNYQASTTGNWCLIPNRYVGTNGQGGPYRASTAINLNNYSGWRKIPLKDPTVIRINGTYYMTGTWTKRCDLASEYWSPYDNSFCTPIKTTTGAEIHRNMPADKQILRAVKAPPNFPVFRSTNMIDWEYLGPAFTPIPSVDTTPANGVPDADEHPASATLPGHHKDEYLRITGQVDSDSYTRYRICRLEQPRFFMDPLDTSTNPKVFLTFSAVMNTSTFDPTELNPVTTPPGTTYTGPDHCFDMDSTNERDLKDRRYTTYFVVTPQSDFVSSGSFTDNTGLLRAPAGDDEYKLISRFVGAGSGETSFLGDPISGTSSPGSPILDGGITRHGAIGNVHPNRFRRYFSGTTFRPVNATNLVNDSFSEYPRRSYTGATDPEWMRFSQMLGNAFFFADPNSSGSVYVSYDWYQPPTDIIESGDGSLNGWNTAIQKMPRISTGNLFKGLVVSSVAFTPGSSTEAAQTDGLDALTLKPLTNGAGPTVGGFVEGCRALDANYSLTAGRVNCPGSFGSSLFYWPLVQRYFLTTNRNERKSSHVRLFSRSASQTSGLSSLWKSFNAKTGTHSWNTPDTSDLPFTSVEAVAANTSAGSRGAAYYGGQIFMGPGDKPYLVFTKQEEFDCTSAGAPSGDCLTYQSEMASLPHYLYDSTIYFKELTMAADQTNLLQLVGPGVKSNYKAFGAASAANLQYYRIPKP